ncbi:Gfo/Idh/MocA family protein [Candidatus Latescibacterota bacterium]
MDMIRWGIIGCGDVAEVKSGPGFQNADGSSLIAVMRRNALLAEDYALRHNVEKWYDNALDLIHDPDVDAVYIATPPSSHKEYTLAAANAGKPVYVEKPMALSYNECVEMIESCEEKKVPLFVAYYRRALPRFLKIKSLLDDNAIGDVRFVNVVLHQKPTPKDVGGIKHWRVDPEIAGGGYFYDLAPHMLDILQFFLGDIAAASGYCSNLAGLYATEDCVSGAFVFESGIHAAGVWNFCAYKDLDRTEIIGSDGKITFSTFGNDPILLEDQNGINEFKIDNPLHIQQPLIQSIVDDLHGTGTCPSTGRTAAKTNWALSAISSQ